MYVVSRRFLGNPLAMQVPLTQLVHIFEYKSKGQIALGNYYPFRRDLGITQNVPLHSNIRPLWDNRREVRQTCSRFRPPPPFSH
jgi:hypothetical protein